MVSKGSQELIPIGKVARLLGLKQHMLRYWESKFEELNPTVENNMRMYNENNIRLIAGLKVLLHDEGLTMRAAQRLLAEKGAKHVTGLAGDISGILGSTPADSKIATDRAKATMNGRKARQDQDTMHTWDQIIGTVTKDNTGLNFSLGKRRFTVSRARLRGLDPGRKELLLTLKARLTRLMTHNNSV